MVAVDAKPENGLVNEIRKALGGPQEALVKTLSSLHAWADEVLSAVVECVEGAEGEGGEKKKGKEKRGRLTMEMMRVEGVKRFLTDHMSQLGVEGACRLVEELGRRVEEEEKEREVVRTYAYLLAHLISAGANVMGYERLRGTVKETLGRVAVGLWRRGVRDASYSLARVLTYLLLAERDYLEGEREGGGEEWWREKVMGGEKKLKHDPFFAVLTTLMATKRGGREEEKGWGKVDFSSLEKESVKGEEGVMSARWVLIDTIVPHTPSLAARCPPTVYRALLEVAVRGYVEREELRSLMTRLSSLPDLPRESWTMVIEEAARCIQRVLDGCSESRERLEVNEEGEMSVGKKGRMEKHRVGCGCSAPITAIMRGLAAVRRASVEEGAVERMEHLLLLTLSSFDAAAEVEGPLREGVEILEWTVEKRKSAGPWPATGAQLARCIKAAVGREKSGEFHARLISLSRTLLTKYGERMDYATRLFMDVGHVATRVLLGETSAEELEEMKPSGASKSTDKLVRSLLEWTGAVRRGEQREEKERELLAEWSTSLLQLHTAAGLSTVVLQTMVSMDREQREALLPRVWSDKSSVERLIGDCVQLLLQSAAPDERYERDTENHRTTVHHSAAAVDARLARALCLFLLNCTPYLVVKLSPMDLTRWDRLPEMHAECAEVVLQRARPDAIQSLFTDLPALLDALLTPEVLAPTREEEEEEEEKAELEKELEELTAERRKKGKGKTGKKGEEESAAAAADEPAADGSKAKKRRRRADPALCPARTAACHRLTRLATVATAALSERAAVQPEAAAAALAAAAACLAAAAPGAVQTAAEAAAAAYYELATRCMEVYGEVAGHSGVLAVALATAATRPPPSMDYERSRSELLQHARLLAAAARHCKQGLMKDQVSLYATLLARVLQSTAAHAERMKGTKGAKEEEADPSCPAAKRRRRDEQRTLHAAAKAANAVNEETQFARVMPFVLADCLLPLRSAHPSIQYPAVLLSHAIDRYGRAFLATCLPPAERLVYTRMFSTLKEMNKRVV